MSFIRINRHPSRRQLALFGVCWMLAFGVLGGFALYRGESWPAAAVLWGVAAIPPAVGWTAPAWMRILYLGLSYATWPVGLTVSVLLLAIVYYLVLTPIGLLLRLCGYDAMNRRRDADASTYWHVRKEPNDPSRYLHQF